VREPYQLSRRALVASGLAVDWIASEGRYSSAVWRGANEESQYVRFRVQDLVERIGL